MGSPPSKSDSDAVRTALLEWYAARKRDLPWREVDDPYAILVAEVMSQQTQLERVVDAWGAFLDRWPTVEVLADAAPGEVIAFWSTHRLGYNRRAEYLHAAAQHVVETWDGDFRTTPSALSELKGVGPYTANAVASFAFGEEHAVVDTNVKRVLHRFYGLDSPDDEGYRELAAELIPADAPGTWNNAIMELGALVCEPTPQCDAAPCPWREWCEAYRTGDFTAPDVPSQPSFDGSRRQFRGRIVRAVSERGALGLEQLGSLVRVDYGPEDPDDKAWLRDLVADLEEDGLVSLSTDEAGNAVVTPRGECTSMESTD